VRWLQKENISGISEPAALNRKTQQERGGKGGSGAQRGTNNEREVTGSSHIEQQAFTLFNKGRGKGEQKTGHKATWSVPQDGRPDKGGTKFQRIKGKEKRAGIVVAR